MATQDPSLLRQILGSARATTGCLGELAEAPTVESMLTEGISTVRSAEVCAYRRGAGGGFDLAYATTLTEAAAQATHDGVYAGQRRSSPAFCAEGGDEYVVVTFTGDDPFGDAPVSQEVVIDPVCHEVEGGPGVVSPLADAAMVPWSRNGLQVVLFAFIGMLG